MARRRSLSCKVRMVLAAVWLVGLPVAASGQATVSPAPLADPTQADLEMRVAQNDSDLGRALSEIERAQNDLSRVEAELGTIGQRRDAAMRQLRLRVRALYRVTRGGLLPGAGGLDALMEHASRVERLQRMVSHDVQGVTQLRGRGLDLRASQVRLRERLARVQRQRATLEAAKRQLEQERQQAELFAYAYAMTSGAGSLGGGWGASAPAMTPSQPGAARVQDYGYGQIIVHDDSGSASFAAEEGDGFATMRGNLGSPVNGEMAVRPSADGSSVDIVTGPGRGVRAAAPGRVAFAGREGQRGLLVILDHGDRYLTVYGGLASIDVRLHDDVSQGARLGGVASDALHFEVRRGRQQLDAREWLGL